MKTVPALVDHRGSPIATPTRPKTRAGLSGDWARAFPYDASNIFHRETEGWYPQVYSQDYEFNIHRDRIVGRSRDLARNDGWFGGGIDRILDATIGSHWRFVSMPDYRKLAFFGPGFDAQWANEFSQAFEAYWRGYVDDPGFYCDATRQLNFTQQMRLALRHQIVDGEDLIVNEWKPERVGYGAARFATCYRIVDPDRLSNPSEMIDTMYRRGGVELDDDGAPLGYHIRRAHQFDWYGAVESMQWEFVARETDWGRRIVTHDYDRERADQHRGVPLVTPVMNRMKMLAKYDQVELQAAVLNAILSIFITSPHDPEGLRDSVNSTEDSENADWYWQTRKTYRDEKPLQMNEATVMTGFPGEKPEVIQASRPGPGHDEFTHYALRNVAAKLGTTAEEMTLDWSKTNYSSARAGFVVAAKTLNRRRGNFATNMAMPCVVAWAEEWFESKECRSLLPKGAPDFLEAREAYTRGRFLGPGRGYIDPVKEGDAAILRMDAAFSTLQHECAEQGFDWRENLDQRQIEIDEFKKRGIPLPEWSGQVPASETDQKPLPT
jgi:lambda family phage portal protein